MLDNPNANVPLPAVAHSLPWESIDPEDTLGKYAAAAPTEPPSSQPPGMPTVSSVDPATQQLFQFDEPSAIAPAISPLPENPVKLLPSPIHAEAPEQKEIAPAATSGPSVEVAASLQTPLPPAYHEPAIEPADPRVETEIAIAEPVVQTVMAERSPNRPLVTADISHAPEPKATVRQFQHRFDFAKKVLVKTSRAIAHSITPSTGTPGQGRGGGLASSAPLKSSSPSTVAPAEATQAPNANPDVAPQALTDGGGWTITLLCVGLALIAACIIIPQADANRRLAYQGKQLSLDLGQIQKQVAVNKDFLQKIQSDPQLAERLAQRQMKLIRQGETVLDIQPVPESAFDQLNAGNAHSQDAHRMSPFSITTVPPAPPLPAYEPAGGQFASLCRSPQTRLYILGAALFMVAAGLVLGGSAKIQNPS